MRAYLLTLFLTMLLGVVLRFELVGGTLAQLGLTYPDLRHAHSHVGFYGALTLAWWLLFGARPHGRDGRTDDAPLMGRVATRVYLGLVLVTSALFAVMGYALPTIIGSTLVAGFWLVAAWRVLRDPNLKRDWVALAPWGVLVGMLIIPAIAVTARRDLALSRDLAHVFIGVMLLVTFVPIALSALRVPRFQPFAYGLVATLGTAYVVFSHRLPWPLGLFLTLAGLALAHGLRGLRAPLWLGVTWWGLPVGLALMGLAPPLQQEGVRIAALHYMVLGPLLLTTLQLLAPHRIAARPIAFAVALAALAVKLAVMVLGPLFALPGAWTIAAWAAVVLVLALAVVLLWPARRATPPAPSG